MRTNRITSARLLAARPSIGLQIKFVTDDKLGLHNYFEVLYDRARFFKTTEVNITVTPDAVLLEVTATEVGYSQSKLSERPNLDIRELLDRAVVRVTDRTKINEIEESANLC